MIQGFRFGIEEEYFLADGRTGRSPAKPAAARFHAAVEKALPTCSRELLVGQVEAQTEPRTSLDDAHADLQRMRRTLAGLAEDAGLSVLAAGSQPLAFEEDQHVTEKTRYQHLAAKVGAMAERVMVCAMHVHAELPDPDRRIQVMNRVLPYLPLLLALSVSSPFWEGGDTGLRGFRLAAFAEWPHMGLPVRFDSQREYETFVAVLIKAKVIPDGSFVWWLIRPAARYPTLELRICDSCTRADEAVAIAALYRSLVCAAFRRPDAFEKAGPIHWGVTTENVWQVQHLGLAAKLIDARGETHTIAKSLDAAIALTAEETEMLGATDWVARTRAIVAGGTSADRQLAVFRSAERLGGEKALRVVTRHLAEETLL